MPLNASTALEQKALRNLFLLFFRMELERDSLDVSIRPSVDMWTWILIASRDW
jgi:hypothetical protein